MEIKVKSGISLITVIITIIVMIILAAISIRTLTTRESAVTAKYVQEFAELKKEVETKRIINSKTRCRKCRQRFLQSKSFRRYSLQFYVS